MPLAPRAFAQARRAPSAAASSAADVDAGLDELDESPPYGDDSGLVLARLLRAIGERLAVAGRVALCSEARVEPGEHAKRQALAAGYPHGGSRLRGDRL